jgi:hypothetical protein
MSSGLNLSRGTLEVIAAIIVIIIMVGVAFAIPLLYKTTTIPGTGSIKSIGVAFYTNPNATTNATSIAWGLVTPGYTYNDTLYCKNVKTSNVTLSLAIVNWSPTNAGTYLHPGWNYTGALLMPSIIIPIKFTLQVFSNATNSGITNFSFGFNVTAAG